MQARWCNGKHGDGRARGFGAGVGGRGKVGKVGDDWGGCGEDGQVAREGEKG